MFPERELRQGPRAGRDARLRPVRTVRGVGRAGKIRDRLAKDPERYQLMRRDDILKHEIIEPELPDSYLSVHARKSGPIEIHHIFLLCHG